MIKRLSGIFIFALLGISVAGCDNEIDADEFNLQSVLTRGDLCTLSGGEYVHAVNPETGVERDVCRCGGTECGENVNCRLNDNGKEPVCGGIGFTFLTEGLCTMNGVEVCSDRIGLDGKEIGYFTKCENNRWTDEAICLGKSSCEVYKFAGFAMSSRCGKCQNDGEKCIGGKLTKDN